MTLKRIFTLCLMTIFLAAAHAEEEGTELNCTVEVNSSKIQNVNKEIFNTLQQSITEYLNVIYLGGSNYGVKVAAQDYFGKDLSELSLRECAALARLIRNPYRYNPRRCYYTLNKPEQVEDAELLEAKAEGEKMQALSGSIRAKIAATDMKDWQRDRLLHALSKASRYSQTV